MHIPFTMDNRPPPDKMPVSSGCSTTYPATQLQATSASGLPCSPHGQHRRRAAADQDGPGRADLEEGQHQQDDRRQHHGPRQVKALLQGGQNGLVHPLDGVQQGRSPVERQGERQGQGRGPPHPQLKAVLLHPARAAVRGR